MPLNINNLTSAQKAALLTALVDAGVAPSSAVTAVSARVQALENGTPTPTPTALKVAFLGSSTPDKYFTEYTGTSNSGVTRSTDGTNFSASNAGIGAVTFGNRLNALLSKPIKLLDLGVAGSSVKEWDDNTSTTAWRTPAVNAILAAGGVDVLVWIGGFNDAKQALITNTAAHVTRLRSLFSKLRTELGQPNLKIIFGMSQNDYSSGASANDVYFNYLHAAEQAVVEVDTNVFFGANSWDLSQLADGIHQTETAYPVHATRLADNTAKAIAGTSTDMGPTITGVTGLTFTTTELTLTHDGGTDITPTTGIGGFVVKAGSTALAISAAERTAANKILLTHASNNGTPVTVTHQAGASPTKTPSLRDNSDHAGYGQPAQHVSIGITAASAGTGTPVSKVAQVNFRSNVTTRVSTTNPTDWNAFTASEDAPSSDIGATSTTGMAVALKTPAGVATGWTLTTTQPSRGASNNTMTGTQTMPADVANSWWTNGDSGTTPPNARIASTLHTISGLDPAKTYKLGFYGRRETTTARQTKYSAGDQSVTQTNNQQNGGLVEITGLTPDGSGNLTYTYEPAGTAAFGYLNAVVITEL